MIEILVFMTSIAGRTLGALIGKSLDNANGLTTVEGRQGLIELN